MHEHPRMPHEREACAALARVIEDRRDEIVRRWLERVAEELGDADRVSDSELRNAVPDYLVGLAELLRSPEPPGEPGGGALWERVAREHAVTRVRQGFDIASVLREFILLRGVIVDAAREAGLTAEALFESLTQALEAAIEHAVASYVVSRDREAQRIEAQHVAFVTHELRNPLGTAVLAVTQLRELVPDAPSIRQLLDAAERAHAKLGTLIEGVLTVEKAQAGEIVPAVEDTRLEDVVEEAITGARAQATLRRRDLEVALDPQLRLRIDPRLTASAVQNLVDNALKYSESGPVRVWSESTDRGASIHVRDRCGGLSKDELHTLFVPFRRGRHRRGASGAGLGLAITKQAIEAQGGSVHAESVDGGCHFWIELPWEARSTGASQEE